MPKNLSAITGITASLSGASATPLALTRTAGGSNLNVSFTNNAGTPWTRYAGFTNTGDFAVGPNQDLMSSPTLTVTSAGAVTSTSFNGVTGLGSATPTALAASGSAGSSTSVARQDHVHPLPVINYGNSSASSYQLLWGSGNVIYGTAAVTIAPNTATITAAAFNATSTRDSKENIKPFAASALDLVNSTEIVEYNYKADDEKTYRVGFIADDTNEIMAGKDHDRFDTTNTVAVLLKAVQELSVRVAELEAR